MSSRARTALAVLLVLAAAVVPYLGVLDAPFVFDDVKLVKENRLLHELWESPGKLIEIFDIASRRWDEDELRPNYRPLRFISYLVDYAISRWWFGAFPPENPPVFFFHLTNVALHAANALLVFLAARRIFASLASSRGDSASTGLPGVESRAAGAPPADLRTGSWTDGLSLMGGVSTAVLFALHPLGTEAVAYISGRRDVLSTFFFLAALAVHVRVPPREAPRIGTIIAVPALFALGLLSKEMAITLPALLLLVDLALRARWTVSRLCLNGACWVVAGAFIAVTVLNPHLVQTVPPGEAGAGVILTAVRYVARYLGLACLPYPQSVDYSFDAIPLSTGLLLPWTTLPSLLVVVILVGFGLWGLLGRTTSPWRALAAVGVLWFVGTLVPVLQFVPVAERFAERFAYLPVAGILLVAALLVARAWRFEPILGHGLLVLLVLACLALTVHRNKDWASPLDLWTSATEAQPRAARAHLGRANALKDARQWREAVREYTIALEIFSEKPDVPLHHGFILQARTLRGGVLGILGAVDPELLDQAIEDYRSVLSSKDTDGTVIEGSARHTALHFDLAGFLLHRRKLDEARREYQRVIDIGSPPPLVSAAHYYQGGIALVENNLSAARDAYRKAYETLPAAEPKRYQVAAELVDILISLKDLDGAWKLTEEALAADAPPDARIHLRYRQAKVLDRRGDLDGCVAALDEILRGAPAYGPALVTLAGIELNLGKLDEAERRYRAVPPGDPSYAEATKGLESVVLRRKLGAGQAKSPTVEEEKVLEALEEKGRGHLSRGELIAAREAFVHLVARSRSAGKTSMEARALRELAGVEEKFNRHGDAEDYLDRALELDPKDPAALRQMGDFQLRRKGETARAVGFYKRYLEALPAGVKADPMVYFNLASLLGSTDPSAALEYGLKAREGGLDSAALDRSLGYLYASLEKWDRSLEAFTRYLQRDGEASDVERETVRVFVKETVLPRVSGSP